MRARQITAPAPSFELTEFMPACQEKSPTKITKITAAGRGGAHTYCLFPRPKVYSAQVQSSLPRTAVGVNEYFYALSLREHGAVRCVAAGSSIHLPLAPLTAVLPVGITRVALPPKPLRRGRAGGRVGASRWEVDVHTATPPLLISTKSNITSSMRRLLQWWRQCGACGSRPLTPWRRRSPPSARSTPRLRTT